MLTIARHINTLDPIHSPDCATFDATIAILLQLLVFKKEVKNQKRTYCVGVMLMT